MINPSIESSYFLFDVRKIWTKIFAIFYGKQTKKFYFWNVECVYTSSLNMWIFVCVCVCVCVLGGGGVQNHQELFFLNLCFAPSPTHTHTLFRGGGFLKKIAFHQKILHVFKKIFKIFITENIACFQEIFITENIVCFSTKFHHWKYCMFFNLSFGTPAGGFSFFTTENIVCFSINFTTESIPCFQSEFCPPPPLIWGQFFYKNPPPSNG